MTLLMPFYFDYDLLLLSVAAVTYAVDKLLHEPARFDRAILATWVTLFAWLAFNPFVAGRTHVNGTVILLCALVALMIARICSDTETVTATDLQQKALAP